MPDRIELAELNIRIVGDMDEASQGIVRLEALVAGSFKKMDGSSESLAKATDKVDTSFKDLDKSAINTAARIQVMEKVYDQLRSTIRGAVDIAQLGAASERVEDRFVKFAQTIGDADEILAAFQRGAGGTVDKLTAMNTAALLVQQGLVTNAVEMEKTVELATRLGNQTLSAADRLQYFSQLLRNQSIRLLDDFGISSGRVRDRIKALQDATAGLSREEAFRIAVFEEGQKALDILGERVDDNAAKFERAKAKWQDARIEFGEKLAPALAMGAEFIASLDSATLILVATLSSAVGVAAKFAGGLGNLLPMLHLSGRQFAMLTVEVGSVIAIYQAWISFQNKVADGQRKVNEAIAAMPKQSDEAITKGKSYTEVMDDLAQKAVTVNDILHKNGNAIQDVATAYARSKEKGETVAAIYEELHRVALEGTENYAQYSAAIDKVNAKLEGSGLEVEKFNTVLYKLASAQLASQNAALEAADAEEDLAEKTEKASQAVLTAIEALDATGERGKQAADVIDRLRDRLDETSKSQRMVGEDANLLVAAFNAEIINSTTLEHRLLGLVAGTDSLTESERVAMTTVLELTEMQKVHQAQLDANAKSVFGYANAILSQNKNVTDASMILDSLSVALGQTSQAEILLKQDAELLTEGFAEGILSANEYQIRLQALAGGNIALSESHRENLTAMVEAAEAAREHAKAYEELQKVSQDYLLTQIATAEQLKDATAERVAQTAIRELEKAHEAGTITFEDYATSVVDIQDKFGLADDTSRALTLGLGHLVSSLSDGTVQATQFGDALTLLIEDAQDGVIQFEELLDRVSRLGQQMETFTVVLGPGEEVQMTQEEYEQMFGQQISASARPTSVGRMEIIDAMTGQVMATPSEHALAPSVGQGGVTIYGGIHLEGVQDVEDFLAQLQALMPQVQG